MILNVPALQILSSAENESNAQTLYEFGTAVLGFGHFVWDDRAPNFGGVRMTMEDADLRLVLLYLSSGWKKVNMKFLFSQNWEIEEAGWKLQFKNSRDNGGVDAPYYLWLSNQDGGVPFKAVVERIHPFNGSIINRQELTSEADGERQMMKCEGGLGTFIRFNIDK
ncbi:Oidioi.mRNA.OKI2018_I69.PAR.g9470.t1.cds [Oikopleura dioica]|uniref:Oidioi.mRNA.OKI2018_I69.PAR.g9470.t1.cds n=1 Tax=Oikopleura dioica TaxID=34765 RepID=A0ABN7RKY2_OIKDI|nr:Oidioi.mRNA.OKI2018_I69.PAR.g9470.t1.cds [Oikopleura dioica]